MVRYFPHPNSFLKMPNFSHLHVHSQFSLLDGAAPIKGMMQKAQADGMKAVALTDHGNMFGAFQFVSEAKKHDLIPVVGCEFYLVEDRFQKSFTGGKKDKRYHQLMLAKDQNGYKNLSKLCSLGYIDGLYSKYPRIDKDLVRKYKDGLIATTCCIGAEVPQTILRKGEEEGEKVFQEWLEIFGDDYFIELQRHGLQDIDGSGLSQEDVNQILVKWSKKYNVPVIATNDSHYVDQDDANAHDILLCVNTGDKKSTPVGDGKGFRFGFPNDKFYFKTQEEMNVLFSDLPEAIDNTNLVLDRITPPKLENDILLPNYTLPEGFADQNAYLRHLTFEGARKKYGEITAEVEQRLNFELKVIADMGFPGYFLIVQDFTDVARKLGVDVGPGRGSAAGSAVAYSVGITNIDPIKYKLLFERFLNPERVSMPDIDIDFDDEGRGKVIDYVVDKYGKNQVAQIITYGSMAARSAIRDVGRVMDLPLPETDQLAKLVPDISLEKVFNSDLKQLTQKLKPEQVQQVEEMRKIAEGNDLKAQTLKDAVRLEGSVRNTGTHACGVIISPDDITEHIPVKTEKGSELLITQYDNKVVESAGLLKMDFLGLKTLTIIKDAIALIKERHGVEIDADQIPLDDEITYALYQRGETNGTFQFESVGMQKHLKELKPNNIEDLIAMNALYRPGPMQYIDTFIKRKQGKEKVEYPHDLLEDILKDTYGIMVYQEQIMQTAQILSGFSLGQADILRRAMGKKDMDKMVQMRAEFVKGAAELHQIKEAKANEVFDIMMKFAEYGFNRSHSAAYSVVAFQTGYLKANYPAEYMASVLTHNMSDIKKVTFFMEECRRMGLKVLGPAVNESAFKFRVNDQGQVRFGLGAVKGVGENAVEAITSERNTNGRYQSVGDLMKRVDLQAANKKCFENLVLAGALDDLDETLTRSMFFAPTGESSNWLEDMLKFGNAFNKKSNDGPDLFGNTIEVEVKEPPRPEVEAWHRLDQLSREKDVVGIYISGHPLDEFRFEIDNFCRGDLSYLANMDKYKGKELRLAGIVTKAEHRVSKGGKPFGSLSMEDYFDDFRFMLFGEDYMKFKHLLEPGTMLFLSGRVQNRKWGNQDELEFKVTSIELLSELRQKVTDSVTIQLPLEAVTEQLIEDLESWLKSSKGDCKVKFKVLDAEEKIALELPSSLGKVDLSPEMIEKLDRMPELEYAVNA